MGWEQVKDPAFQGFTVKRFPDGVRVRCTCYRFVIRRGNVTQRWQVVGPDLRSLRQAVADHDCAQFTAS